MKRLQGSAAEVNGLRQRLSEAERARDEADQRASDAESRIRAEDRASRARPDTGEARRIQRALVEVEHERDDLRARNDALEAELRQLRGKAGTDRDGRASMTDRVRQLDQQVAELQRENATLREDLQEETARFLDLVRSQLRRCEEDDEEDDD